ncbi:hypothetical protein JRI60_23325 [Archangium violaceum]|uniref:hypothetical protein n=1 Tax=Archangium violaceum TaxID=83451 RepID=UPI00194E70F7|nr:hypothetical protein [Archangium violaceum]QRO01745.1 hypothetical protein JRI60_23325 [Archangium violaceum]
MTTPIQAFAFDFSWPLQGQAQPLANQILITDTPNAADTVAVLIQCLANPGVTITLIPQTNQVASASNYHFELYFDPGALAGATGIKVSDTAQWSFACVQHPTGTNDSKTGVSLYLLSKSTLRINPQNPLTLNATNIGAASQGGERSSVATFNWNESSYVVEFDPPSQDLIHGQGNPYQLTEQRTFDIVSPPSNAAASPLPLYASFSTPNVVANDGTSKNLLVVRLVNTGQDAINLSPQGSGSPTQLVLFFDTSSSNNDRWALSADSQVHDIYLPGKEDSSGIDTSWSGNGSWQVSGPDDSNRWTLTPGAGKTSLAPGESLEIPISNIVTGYATGQTTLHLRYEDFPDHPDGEAQLNIQKLPMFYQNNVLYRVGVNTTAPEEQLHVANGGNLRVDGQYKSWGPIDFQPNTDKSPSDEDLLRLRDMNGNVVMTGTSNGKLGLGTTSPSETLEVQTGSGSYGITHTDGNVRLSSYVSSTGGWLGTQSNHNLSFYTNNSQAQMVLDTSGNLGINSGSLGIGTTSPSEALHVYRSGANVAVAIQRGDGGTLKLKAQDSQNRITFDKNLLFDSDESGTTRMAVTTGGNIGIGTTSPAETLHISGGSLRVDGPIKNWGTIDLYPNVDQSPPDEDLFRVRDMNGNAILTIQSDGSILYKGQRPMAYQLYIVNQDSPNIDTGYNFNDWVAVIAGVNAKLSSKSMEGICFLPGSHSGSNNWILSCDVIGGPDSFWNIQALFIRREFVNVVNTFSV